MVDLCEDAEVVVDLAERLHQRQATKDKWSITLIPCLLAQKSWCNVGWCQSSMFDGAGMLHDKNLK